MNAIRFPSCDHEGRAFDVALCVICFASLPSAFITQSCPSGDEYAIFAPVGRPIRRQSNGEHLLPGAIGFHHTHPWAIVANRHESDPFSVARPHRDTALPFKRQLLPARPIGMNRENLQTTLTILQRQRDQPFSSRAAGRSSIMRCLLAKHPQCGD
jgi:hypothetical protein